MPVIVDLGLNGVAQSIFDSISHVAIGDGIGPELETDTQLVNEVFRIAPDNKASEDRVVTVRTFFRNQDLPPEVREVGIFLRGDGEPNSGELLARWVTSIFGNMNDLVLWLYLEITRESEEEMAP